MINNKGSITLLTIYICIFVLLLALLTQSIFMENYYYYKHHKKSYDLFLIENAIIKNIYNDYRNVFYQDNRVYYKGSIVNNNEDQDIKYSLNLIVDKDIYEYEIIYDRICFRVVEFNNITNIYSN